jgi:hypothetical protein
LSINVEINRSVVLENKLEQHSRKLEVLGIPAEVEARYDSVRAELAIMDRQTQWLEMVKLGAVPGFYLSREQAPLPPNKGSKCDSDCRARDDAGNVFHGIERVKANRNECPSPGNLRGHKHDGEHCRPPFHGDDEESGHYVAGSDGRGGNGGDRCRSCRDPEEFVRETRRHLGNTKQHHQDGDDNHAPMAPWFAFRAVHSRVHRIHQKLNGREESSLPTFYNESKWY